MVPLTPVSTMVTYTHKTAAAARTVGSNREKCVCWLKHITHTHVTVIVKVFRGFSVSSCTEFTKALISGSLQVLTGKVFDRDGFVASQREDRSLGT